MRLDYLLSKEHSLVFLSEDGRTFGLIVVSYINLLIFLGFVAQLVRAPL